mmetsp:Transcript_109056/g.307404  ORF Transcript_109056/g.307404 Transcript_109056/m.307404 type:complete len:220 (-) Transcript_109056:612-1271(-)
MWLAPLPLAAPSSETHHHAPPTPGSAMAPVIARTLAVLSLNSTKRANDASWKPSHSSCNASRAILALPTLAFASATSFMASRAAMAASCSAACALLTSTAFSCSASAAACKACCAAPMATARSAAADAPASSFPTRRWATSAKLVLTCSKTIMSNEVRSERDFAPTLGSAATRDSSSDHFTAMGSRTAMWPAEASASSASSSRAFELTSKAASIASLST